MSSESVCQVARSWVDVGSFHTRFVVRFMNFTASVRNILDTPPYILLLILLLARFLFSSIHRQKYLIEFQDLETI
jgi:hypothetical protein